jgi:hypothetical protein
VPKSTVGNAARNELAVEKLKRSTVSVVKHSTMATGWERRGTWDLRRDAHYGKNNKENDVDDVEHVPYRNEVPVRARSQ